MRKTTYVLVGVLTVVIIIAALASLFVTNSPGTNSNSKLKVVATFYPLYDFAQNVGGDKVTVSILVPETTHDVRVNRLAIFLEL